MGSPLSCRRSRGPLARIRDRRRQVAQLIDVLAEADYWHVYTVPADDPDGNAERMGRVAERIAEARAIAETLR